MNARNDGNVKHGLNGKGKGTRFGVEMIESDVGSSISNKIYQMFYTIVKIRTSIEDLSNRDCIW